MRKTPNIPHFGSTYALTRFLLRLTIFAVFATLGHQGFGKTLENLLLLGGVYCVLIAVVRNERPFDPLLTHFDEAAAYVVIARLAAWTA